MRFTLRNLDWTRFVQDVGFVSYQTTSEYDVALPSPERTGSSPRRSTTAWADLDLAVFYDLAEQHRILAKNVADYLAPIYNSNGEFVVAVLGPTYGVKRLDHLRGRHVQASY